MTLDKLTTLSSLLHELAGEMRKTETFARVARITGALDIVQGLIDQPKVAAVPSPSPDTRST